jgi:hypothetical protein
MKEGDPEGWGGNKGEGATTELSLASTSTSGTENGVPGALILCEWTRSTLRAGSTGFSPLPQVDLGLLGGREWDGHTSVGQSMRLRIGVVEVHVGSRYLPRL